jgi:hypothetical protein
MYNTNIKYMYNTNIKHVPVQLTFVHKIPPNRIPNSWNFLTLGLRIYFIKICSIVCFVTYKLPDDGHM